MSDPDDLVPRTQEERDEWLDAPPLHGSWVLGPDGQPKRPATRREWVACTESPDSRNVKRTEGDGWTVSTVLLPLSLRDELPEIETAIILKGTVEVLARHASVAAAVRYHDHVVAEHTP